MSEKALLLVQQTYINKLVKLQSCLSHFTFDDENNVLTIVLKYFDETIIFVLGKQYVEQILESKYRTNNTRVFPIEHVEWHDSTFGLFSINGSAWKPSEDDPSLSGFHKEDVFNMTVSHSQTFYNVLLELRITFGDSLFYGYFPLAEKPCSEKDLLVAFQTWKNKLWLFD